MSKALPVYEPRIDPTTKRMDVGGLLIPPTNTITALLYGLANHDANKAKEYYFWRLCDELWNNDDLPEPLMVKHKQWQVPHDGGVGYTELVGGSP